MKATKTRTSHTDSPPPALSLNDQCQKLLEVSEELMSEKATPDNLEDLCKAIASVRDTNFPSGKQANNRLYVLLCASLLLGKWGKGGTKGRPESASLLSVWKKYEPSTYRPTRAHAKHFTDVVKYCTGGTNPKSINKYATAVEYAFRKKFSPRSLFDRLYQPGGLSGLAQSALSGSGNREQKRKETLERMEQMKPVITIRGKVDKWPSGMFLAIGFRDVKTEMVCIVHVDNA